MSTFARRILALAFGCLIAIALGEGLLRLGHFALHGTTSDRGGIAAPINGHHPLVGWLPIAGSDIRHHTTEFDVTYRVGPQRFRGLDASTLDTDATEQPTITFLGDSFVFGQGVASTERVTERLAARLGVTVWNRGVQGTGTGQHLLIYTDVDGPHRHGDIVVLGLFADAIRRHVADRFAGRAKPRFRVRDNVLELTGVPVPETYESLEERAPVSTPSWKTRIQRHSRLYGAARTHLRDGVLFILGRDVDPYPEWNAADSEAAGLMRALLAEFARSVRAADAKLLVALIPAPWHLAATRHPERRAAFQHAALTICEQLDIAAIDLTPALRSSDAQAYFPVDGHWTPHGHALAAEAIAAELTRRGWVTR